MQTRQNPTKTMKTHGFRSRDVLSPRLVSASAGFTYIQNLKTPGIGFTTGPTISGQRGTKRCPERNRSRVLQELKAPQKPTLKIFRRPWQPVVRGNRHASVKVKKRRENHGEALLIWHGKFHRVLDVSGSIRGMEEGQSQHAVRHCQLQARRPRRRSGVGASSTVTKSVTW